MCKYFYNLSHEETYLNSVSTFKFKENLSQIFSYFTSFSQLKNLHKNLIFTHIKCSKKKQIFNLDLITSFELLINNDIITIELIEKKILFNCNLLKYKITKINNKKILHFIFINFSFYINNNDNNTIVVLEIIGKKNNNNNYKNIENNIKNFYYEEFKKLKIFLHNNCKNNINILNYESILINRPLIQILKYLNKCEILNNSKYYKLIKIDGNREKINIFLENEISSLEISIIYLSIISSFVEVKRNFNVHLTGKEFLKNKKADVYLLMRLKDKLEKEILY